MEKDRHSTVGLRVVTQSGITQEKRGNEAAVAFCILSDLMIPLDKVKGGVFVLQQLLYAQSK